MGAWIEIAIILASLTEPSSRSLHGSVDWNIVLLLCIYFYRVAPFMGAWIEIAACLDASALSASLPSWERGLKCEKKITYERKQGRSLHGSVDWNMYRWTTNLSSSVAPFMGAWIEMSILRFFGDRIKCRSLHGSVDWNSDYFGIPYRTVQSLPSWERGLKSMDGQTEICPKSRSLHGSVDWNFLYDFLGVMIWSLPSWERGLKCFYYMKTKEWPEVAPFMGAWIEIWVGMKTVNRITVAPFMGAWIEIHHTPLTTIWNTVAPFMGAWIEIRQYTHNLTGLSCRSLHGSVDWNKQNRTITAISIVAPFMGAWIEIMAS